MSDPVTVKLTHDEWDIISAWRDVPPGQLKDVLDELLASLVSFVAEPGCSQVQADGVPCATAQDDCEYCQRVKGVLALVRRDLQRQ